MDDEVQQKKVYQTLKLTSHERSRDCWVFDAAEDDLTKLRMKATDDAIKFYISGLDEGLVD